MFLAVSDMFFTWYMGGTLCVPLEEEVMTPDSDDEGEGEKEKKKKKDPFAGLMMSGGASGPAVKVKFNLAGRQAVPSADTKKDIVVGGN